MMDSPMASVAASSPKADQGSPNGAHTVTLSSQSQVVTDMHDNFTVTTASDAPDPRPPIEKQLTAKSKRRVKMDSQPLLAGFPKESSGVHAPPPVTAARTEGLHLRKADPSLIYDDEEPPSWWAKCVCSACCLPRPRPGKGLAAKDAKRLGGSAVREHRTVDEPAPALPAISTQLKSHGGSAVREHRAVDEPAPAPPAIPTPAALPTTLDLTSPEGLALAQLAGGAWASQLLTRIWPFLRKAVEDKTVEDFPDLIEQNKPSWMEGITLDKFTLGDQVPVVRSVRLDEIDDNHMAEVRLQCDVTWHSSSDIQLTVMPLPAILNRYMPNLLKGVVQYVTSLQVGVQSLELQAQLLVTFAPLVPAIPPMQAVQVSLLRTPDLDFSITVTRGESKILNVLKPWLRSLVASAFASLVLPEHIFNNLVPNAPNVQCPEGVLLVHIVRAENVPKMDYWGHSDTYVDTWVRGRIKQRTPVVKSSANPEWPAEGSTFQLLVHTRRFQVLSFELWDKDSSEVLYDDLIGGASIPLTELQPGVEQELSLQVLNSASGAPGEDAPAGLDPAYAGGRSTVDVSNTRLHIRVRYIPASMAPSMKDEIVGNPGVFHMKLTKVTVPDLAFLPLKARPYIMGCKPSSTPPLSSAIYPLKGKDKETGLDQTGRRDIPISFDAVWDVLGTTEEIQGRTFGLALVASAGTKAENVITKVDVRLADVMAKKVGPAYGGAAGGQFTLRSDDGFEFEMTLMWSPLIPDQESPDKATADEDLQDRLHKAHAEPAHDLPAQSRDGLASEPAGLQEAGLPVPTSPKP